VGVVTICFVDGSVASLLPSVKFGRGLGVEFWCEDLAGKERKMSDLCNFFLEQCFDNKDREKGGLEGRKEGKKENDQLLAHGGRIFCSSTHELSSHGYHFSTDFASCIYTHTSLLNNPCDPLPRHFIPLFHQSNFVAHRQPTARSEPFRSEIWSCYASLRGLLFQVGNCAGSFIIIIMS
jgi:hypothetical protein